MSIDVEMPQDMPHKDLMKATIELAAVKAKKSPLIEYLQKNIKQETSINDVRGRLAKIEGSMSHEIITERAERL